MKKLLFSPYSKIFYYEWRLDSNRSDYNIVFNQDLKGKVGIRKLENAIRRFIKDYVLFNSHIEEENGELYWVENNSIQGLEYFNEKLGQQRILEYIQNPFDLEKGPLYRFGLIKQDKNCHKFIVVIHHLLIDGSTMDFFLQEISNYYNNPGYKPVLPKEEQYYPILNLSQNFSKQLELNKEKSQLFWSSQLAEVEHINLGFLRFNYNKNSNHATKLSIQELGGIGEIEFSFDQEILEKINHLKRRYLFTPYIYGLSIYALLLYRYTMQEKFCISYPVAIKEGVNFIYGAHINTNVIPYDFNKSNNIIDIIEQTTQFFKEIKSKEINHSYLPIYNIIQNSNVNVECIFAQTNLKDTVVNFDNVKATIDSSANIDLVNELVFEQEVKDKNINYRVKYKLKKINPFLLNSFVSCYKRLFVEILEELLQIYIDDGRLLTFIRNYNLLSSKQYQQIVYKWNKTEKEYPKDKAIHQLFEEQVEKTPDNIAVVYEDIKLTYRELNERANQLAHYLRQNYDIKPDTLLVLCLDRSEHMLIAILGSLKAGGAYVPIDNNYPDERIKYILNDTNAKIILTNEIHEKRLKNIIQASIDNLMTIETSQKPELLALDSQELQKQLSLQSVNNLYTETTSAHLIYIIYTSGTTGNPKGVMIEHKGVSNLLNWYTKKYNIVETDKVLIISSYSFDLTQKNILGLLISGGEVHLLASDYDPIQINKIISNQRITILNCASGAFYPLVEELKDTGEFMSLRYVSIGGELLVWSRIKKIFTYNLLCQIVNGYGPTECSDIATSYFLSKEDIEGNNIIPNIGKPIDNVSIFVLDKDMQLVPIGMIGELYIGGAGVGRGYLNNPALTAEKFIANPFQTKEEKSSNKNTRLYKTGDLVRWVHDGNIEYIERNDLQIKIRGHRIELGEIEAVLSSHEGIKQSVVLAKNHIDNNGSNTTESKYLVGYYISDIRLDEDNILSYLHSRLPEYMMPSVLVHLKKLPLTTNGKLDKKALPEPKFINDSYSYIAPRNKLEEMLCNICQKVLGLNCIGINDNFFRLGAHSLSIIKLINEIKAVIEIDLKPIDIFIHNTVLKLYKYISRNDFNKGGAPNIVNFTNLKVLNDQLSSVFFFHGIGGNLISYYKLINNLKEEFSKRKKEIPIFGIEASGINPNEQLFTSSHQMISNYLHSIKKLQVKSNYILVGWSYGAELAFQVAQLLIEQGEEIKGLIVIDSPAYSQETENIKNLIKGSIENVYNDDNLRNLLLYYQTNLQVKLDSDASLKVQFYKLLGYDKCNDIGVIDRLNKVAISNIINSQDFTKKICNIKEFVFIKAALTQYTNDTGNWDKFIKGNILMHTIPGDHYSIMEHEKLIDLLSHYVLRLAK